MLEASEALVGNWEHKTAFADAHQIIINENGEGYMVWVIDGKNSKQTKIRKWYLDNNQLNFGKAVFNGEFYEIDEYPTTAFTELINYYDTILKDQRYIILDGNYYKEFE